MITKGVYHIVNVITGDFYVGSAYGKAGIEGRNKKELSALRRNKWNCKNDRLSKIQNAYPSLTCQGSFTTSTPNYGTNRGSAFPVNRCQFSSVTGLPW